MYFFQKDFRVQELPLARIKKIMKLDEDVKVSKQLWQWCEMWVKNLLCWWLSVTNTSYHIILHMKLRG